MGKHTSRIAISRLVKAIHAEAIMPKQEAYIWDIISALRGPDYEFKDIEDNRRLKELTTARIRGVLQLEGAIGIAVETRPLSPEDRIERDMLLQSTNNHFRSHYRYAVEAIKVLYNYDLNSEEEIPCK